MRRKWIWVLVVALIGVAVYVANVLATPATVPGFKGTTLANATFGDLSRTDPNPAILERGHQDGGGVRPLRPAEHVGSQPPRRVHPQHRLAHAPRAEPCDRDAGHRD